MVTLVLGGVILSVFGTMFYLEDRAGVGVYDPDPRPKHKQR